MVLFIMFIILASLLGPSIICTLFLFYHFIRSSQLRKVQRNHLVICLFIINFIQDLIELLPRLYFLYTQIVLIPNPNFCNFWNWCQFTLVSMNLLIVALGSIERYLLIFHRIFLSNHLILRQIFLILCILVPAIFYAIAVYGVQCKTVYNYNSVGCGIPCFFSTYTFPLIIKNIIIISLPIILTIFISCLLLIRIYVQRIKMKRHRQFWKESIQMIIQLLPIIILCLLVWIPLAILFYFSVFSTIIPKVLLSSLVNDYFGNLKYLVNLIYPFLALVGQPELRKKVTQVFNYCYIHRNQRIIPIVPFTMNNNVT